MADRVPFPFLARGGLGPQRRGAMLCVLAVAGMMALAGPALAQGGGVALNGIDAVSLRDSGRAVSGSEGIVTHWRGLRWLFSNEANRQSFESNPRAYVPALGGYCPVAMAQGRQERGDPRLFLRVGDQIFLAADPGALAELRANPEAIVQQARANWKRMGR